MRTGAVILAAGAPDGIREPKPMLRVGQRPMIRRIADCLLQLRISPIVVVTGYRGDIIERCLSDPGIVIVRNRRYAQTDMLDSLKLGLQALGRDCDRAFIFPADLPLVGQDTLQALMRNGGRVVKPQYGGQEGHPLLISSALFQTILDRQGQGGLRELLAELDIPASLVPVEDEAVLLDANSYEDYRRLLDLEADRRGRGKLHLRCEPQLVVEDVIMDSETMQLMEMLECTGSLQLACDLMGIPYTRGWRMINKLRTQLDLPIINCAAGGPRGGGSQLTEQGRALLETYQKLRQESLRMMNWVFQEYFPEDFVENLQKQT